MKILFSCLAVLTASGLFAQSNLSVIGSLPYTQELSDIWAYEDTAGNAYALVGVYNGFSIVDITDPSNPVQLSFIPGASTTWRDIKVWDHYAYVTNEGGNGMLIVDLSDLPNVLNYYDWNYNNQLVTAHNIFIDENGIAYVVGHN
ncbi:MAG: choice-of-anchor B family protein, partial [Chitinophagales bacterium]|nr:choice-of-anchor B family protein [Chitinophagales bacterium]